MLSGRLALAMRLKGRIAIEKKQTQLNGGLPAYLMQLRDM